jgi:hypothetical protein
MAINRAPFNALVDDDGSNTVGSVWNKNAIKTVILDPADVAYASVASPAFTGVPTAPTATPGTNTTQLATTAFVLNPGAPAFTGVPTAPTAAAGTNTTQLATTAFVTTASAPPAWVAVPYNAANFVGTGGMTWTVDSADQVRFSYLLSGKTITVSFWFNSTSLTGTATNEIRITIPAGKVSAAYSAGIVWINNPGSLAGVINAPGGQTYLQIYKIDQSAFTLATNTFLLSGTFTFEIN